MAYGSEGAKIISRGRFAGARGREPLPNTGSSPGGLVLMTNRIMKEGCHDFLIFATIIF